MEKKMKWIGLEWKKRREIGEKICPKSHFFEKTHKTQFQQQIRPFFGEKKTRREYPLAIARGTGGPAPAPD